MAEWDYSGPIPKKVGFSNTPKPSTEGFKTPGGATITQQDVQDVGYKAATGIMGTPVDLVNMFLKPIGLGSEKPIMGSDWMNQQAAEAGLVSNPEVGAVDLAAMLAIPDPLDIVQFTKYATPMLAGAMIPGRVSGGVDDVLAGAQGLEGKQLNNYLNQNIDMKSLSPEDKQKVIDFRRGNVVSKPKATKQESIITAPDFSSATEGVYSKLEDEISKIPDDMTFNSRDELEQYLLKKGVTKSELEGSKFTETFADGSTGANVKNELFNYDRPDKIEKKSIFDQTDTTLEFDDFVNDWVTQSDNVNVSIGESGAGVRLTDEKTGRELEIGYSYDYDRYVDEYGDEIGDYQQMQDDWYENYGKGDYEDQARDLADNDGQVWDELSDTEKKDYEIAAAEDDGPWYDFYNNKEVYETDMGTTYDDLDEAIDASKQSLYDDYVDYADEGETFENYTVSGGDNYDMEIYRMPDYKVQEGKFEHEEPHLKDMANWQEDYENVAFHVRKKDRTDGEGKNGTVLEELQSQWEQDWRAEGGDLTKEQLAEIPKQLDTLKTQRDKFDEQRKVLVKNIDDLKKDQFNMEDAVLTESREFTPDETTEIKQILSDIKKLQDQLGDIDLKRTETGTKIRNLEKKSNPKTSAPALAKRTQYEKVAMMDQLKQAVNSDKDYFGFINGHIQNGSKIDTTKGMIQAYDVELPRILQKLTGEKPYMASFYNGTPVSGKKVYWDSKKAAENTYYKNIADKEINGEMWYWRLDLTPEIKERLRKSKTQLYTNPATIGAAAAVGGAAMYEGQEE